VEKIANLRLESFTSNLTIYSKAFGTNTESLCRAKIRDQGAESDIHSIGGISVDCEILPLVLGIGFSPKIKHFEFDVYNQEIIEK